MAMASTGGPLLYRIQRLMGTAGAEYRPSRLPAILAVCLGLGCLALNVRWARAQEKPPEQAQQPQEPATVTVTKDGQSVVLTLRNGVKPPDEQAQTANFYMAADQGRTATATIGIAGNGQSRDERGIQVDTGGAKVLSREPVRYPLSAAEKNIQGTVVVEVTLDAEGEVNDAHVVSGPVELRKAALESLLNWRFVSDYAGTTRQVSVVFQVPPDWRERQEDAAKLTTEFLRDELKQAMEQVAKFKQEHQAALPPGADAAQETNYAEQLARLKELRERLQATELVERLHKLQQQQQ
jgi:TonB family protein